MNDQHLAKLDRSHRTVGTAIRQSNWLFPFHRDLSSFWHRVISSFDVDSGPAAFGNRAHEALAGVEVDQTTAAVGVVGFCSAVVSGLLMTSSESLKNYHNPAFRLKMLLILLAAFNFWLFHASSYKRVADWDTAPVSPLPARLAGMFSILLWFGIVAAGRFIAFY